MQSLRAIRRKIRSVKNIQQITQAMKMVAAAKLRRVQEKVKAGKPYFEKMQELMECLGAEARQLDHPLLNTNPNATASGLVVITGNRGLCGSYNGNLLRCATDFLNDHPDKDWRLLTVGRKGTEFFRHRDYQLVGAYEQLEVTSTFEEARELIEAITDLYAEGAVGEVYLAYTEFVSTMQQRPQVIRFLPLESESAEAADNEAATEAAQGDVEFLFEPAAAQLMGELLPRYVDTQLYHMLLESLTSEFGARLTAMTAATDNAGELIKTLTLQYNRSRQAAITTEIVEVVSGAEALAADS